MMMKKGWMDDRKVDLAIGFPGFSRAIKTLCFSGTVWKSKCSFWTSICVWCVWCFITLSILYPGVEGYNLCLPPAHQCQWAARATRNVLRLFDWLHAGGSSVGFLDFFDQWAPAVPPAPQLPWHDFFNNSSCSGRLHPNLAPSILTLLPLISSHGQSSRTGECWRSWSEKKSTLSEVACSTDDSKRRPARTICDLMQQSCMLVFDACLSFTAKHSLRQIFHSVKAKGAVRFGGEE